jgi:hypothetical protein
MRIDREAFLLLTASLAQSCRPAEDARRASPPPAENVVVASVVPASSAPVVGQEVSLNSGGCDNDDPPADLATCTLVPPPGPTCEYFDEAERECRGEADPRTREFKPRIAAAIVACLAKQSGTRAVCEIFNASGCVREAIRGSCIEPDAPKKCDTLVAECDALGLNVNFKRSDCELAMSAIPDSTLAEWKKSVIGPMNEGCTFEYFLPYNPFSSSW